MESEIRNPTSSDHAGKDGPNRICNQCCPFVGVSKDPQTRMGYASQGNLCHCITQPALIPIAHQETFCLSEGYPNCSIYLEFMKRGQTLSEAPYVINSVKRFRRRLILSLSLATIATLALLAASFSDWIRKGSDQIAAQWNNARKPAAAQIIEATSTPLEAAALPAPTETSAPAAIPTMTLPPTNTPYPSATVKPTHTPRPTLAPPTPGPGMETPFGEKNLLLYAVREGDYFASIARRFSTTVHVLQALNPPEPGRGLWPDTVLVIQPGLTDREQAAPYRVYQLEQDVEITQLSIESGIPAEEIRSLNSLGPDEEIPGGRWLILPAEN